MISVQELPGLNASLNATSGLLLVLGYFFVRRGRVNLHRACMGGAFVVSVAFLGSYLIYHFYEGSKSFQQEGFWIRLVYFSTLISHTVLASAIPPLAIVTLVRALKGRVEAHRRIAVWTFPIWLYVSVTGVLVYLMLYQWTG